MTVIGPRAAPPTEPGPLPYRAGWFIAWSSLIGSTNPGLIVYTELYGTWGTVLCVITVAWMIVFGIAAAAVRPWAWYVVLAAPLFAMVSSSIFAARIAATPFDAWLGGSLVTALALLEFVYFYRRRALFGAASRWRRAEQWWPHLAGREYESNPGRAGFGGLSPAARWGFVVSLLIGCIVQQVRR